MAVERVMHLCVSEENQLKIPSVTSYYGHRFHSNEVPSFHSTVLCLGTAHSCQLPECTTILVQCHKLTAEIVKWSTVYLWNLAYQYSATPAYNSNVQITCINLNQLTVYAVMWLRQTGQGWTVLSLWTVRSPGGEAVALNNSATTHSQFGQCCLKYAHNYTYNYIIISPWAEVSTCKCPG